MHRRAHRPAPGGCGPFARPPHPPHALRRQPLSKSFQIHDVAVVPAPPVDARGEHLRRRQPLGSGGAPGVAQGRARGQARRRGSGGIEQEHHPDPVPRPPARRGRLVRARGHRHGAVAEGPGGGDGRAAGRRRAAAPGRRHRAEHGRRAGDAGAPRRRGRGERLRRRVVLRAQLPPGRRLPGAARRRGGRPDRPGRRPRRDHRPGGARRLPRRDPARPDGRADAPRAGRPHHGGDRLVPAGGAPGRARASPRPTRARPSCRRAR